MYRYEMRRASECGSWPEGWLPGLWRNGSHFPKSGSPVSTPDHKKIPKKIADEAVAWLVRQDAEPLTPEARAEFERWLEADPLHRLAYERVRRVWAEMGQLPVAAVTDDRKSRSRPVPGSSGHSGRIAVPARGRSRRHVLAGSALAACVALFVMILAGSGLSVRWQSDYYTEVGEMRTVKLPDGSLAYLNTGSALRLDFEGGQRNVHLLAGEAEFQVAHDPDRAFVVRTRHGTAEALGTDFVVRRMEANTRVSVLENRVRVTSPEGREASSRQVILEPAQRVQLGPEGLGTVEPVSLKAANAWRRGKVIFENRPLEEVIIEVNRYHSGWIRILGDDLKRLSVNGVFRIDDSEDVVTALEESLHLNAIHLTRYLVVLY